MGHRQYRPAQPSYNNHTREKKEKKKDKRDTSSSDLEAARLRTSTHRQTAKKFLSSELSVSGFFSVGVPLVAIKYSAFRGSSSMYGGSCSIISIAMIPRDQTSTLAPYCFCLTTSGAIQYDVPTSVARLFFWSVNLAQNPKSAIVVVKDQSTTMLIFFAIP